MVLGKLCTTQLQKRHLIFTNNATKKKKFFKQENAIKKGPKNVKI